MKYIIKVLLLVFLASVSLSGEDYQYQYFAEKNGEKDKYVPFSDYIPKVRQHYKTVPHYVEDYYLLYGMQQHYDENSLRMNILRLKTALNCKFRHPSEALIKITDEKEYYKYRNLMYMHINVLILRNYLKIAVRYDKRNIYFYDNDFAEHLKVSLQTAEELYLEAMPYWREAERYAKRASEVKITTDLGYMESERYSIIKGDVNYERIINGYVKNTKTKRAKLDELIRKR